MTEVTNIENILRNKITEQITADLTTGRTENGIKAFTHSEIQTFIANNEQNISNIIAEMIECYTEDGDLHELLNPEDDWIREFLYETIDFDSI